MPGRFITDNRGYVVVYCDGSCFNNGRYGAKAGIGVYFNDYHHLNVAAPVEGPATNNNAEIQAVRVALTQAAGAGIRNLQIHTDSEFVIKAMTRWIDKLVLLDAAVAQSVEQTFIFDPHGLSVIRNAKPGGPRVFPRKNGAWKMNGWRLPNGEPVKNTAEFMKLDRAIQALNKVEFIHVHGHSQDRGNDIADKFARKGAAEYV